jgi:hypothetical protein
MASLLYKGNRGIRMIWNKHHLVQRFPAVYLLLSNRKWKPFPKVFEKCAQQQLPHPAGPAVLLLVRKVLVLVSVVRRGNAPVNAEQGSGSTGFSKSATADHATATHTPPGPSAIPMTCAVLVLVSVVHRGNTAACPHSAACGHAMATSHLAGDIL